MKNVMYALVAFLFLGMTSCGSDDQSAVTTDSTAVDTVKVDSVKIDSAVAVTDTTVAEIKK